MWKSWQSQQLALYTTFDLRVIFQSARRIKSFFPYKDLINRSQMSKVVYKASCWDHVTKPWPYFGNLIEVARFGGLHKAFIEYGKKYGKLYKMYMGRSPIITVANLEMLKQILVKDFHKFQNRPDVMRGNAPMDKGLFDARDEAWRKVRSILTPTFSALKLKELVPLIDDAANILLEKLETSARNGKFAKK